MIGAFVGQAQGTFWRVIDGAEKSGSGLARIGAHFVGIDAGLELLSLLGTYTALASAYLISKRTLPIH